MGLPIHYVESISDDAHSAIRNCVAQEDMMYRAYLFGLLGCSAVLKNRLADHQTDMLRHHIILSNTISDRAVCLILALSDMTHVCNVKVHQNCIDVERLHNKWTAPENHIKPMKIKT